MKDLYIILIICFSLTFFSCEKDANIDLGETDKELIVTSFLSPDADTTRVHITYSRSLFGAQNEDLPFDIVSTANVDISYSDGLSIILPYNQGVKAYSIDSSALHIKAGETYFLTVVMPDGKTVTGKCTVPSDINTSINVIGLDSLKNGDAYEFHFDIKWDDIVNIKNYYRVHAYVDREIKDETGFIFNDFERIAFTTNEYEVFDDVLFENASITLREGYYYNAYFDDFNADIISRRTVFYLFNVDENYYKYHSAINSNINVGYFIEPSLTHTNIEGGLGCFGAFTSYRLEDDF